MVVERFLIRNNCSLNAPIYNYSSTALLNNTMVTTPLGDSRVVREAEEIADEGKCGTRRRRKRRKNKNW